MTRQPGAAGAPPPHARPARRRFRRFRRGTVALLDVLVGPVLMLRQVLPSILALLVLAIAAASVFKVYHPDWAWIDASYAAMATITTLGDYGTDMLHMAPAEKVSVIVIVLLSVAVAATALQEIASVLVHRELWLEMLTKRRVARMEGHAVVVGWGACALEVARKLVTLGVQPVVVVPDGTPEEVLEDFAPIPIVRDDLRRHATLTEAGVERAAQVEIAVDDDALALVVTMNARDLSKTVRIVVNVEDEELTKHFKTAGANVVIGSSGVLGRIMAVAGVAENASGLIFSADQGLQKEIGVFRVAEGSFAAGKSVDASGIDDHAWILGLVRGGTFDWETARGTMLLPGDDVVVLGDVRSFGKIREIVVGAASVNGRS